MHLSFAAKRLWHLIRAAYHALRKGFSKHKLILDLHLLLTRGKIAGKSIGKLLTYHHHMNPQLRTAFSFHNPSDVDFSCSNTPFYSHFPSAQRNRRHPFDAAALTNALEMLSSEYDVGSPSPAPVRQLRITEEEADDVSPVDREAEEEADDVCHVDREAEEFIRRFHEQLRLQRTPEYQSCRRRTRE